MNTCSLMWVAEVLQCHRLLMGTAGKIVCLSKPSRVPSGQAFPVFVSLKLGSAEN